MQAISNVHPGSRFRTVQRRRFGEADSATERFSDGGGKCFMRKKCVFLKYFEG